MVDSDWYLDEVRSELSQGDILEGVPFSTLVAPLTPLTKSSKGKSEIIWVPPDPETDAPAADGHALSLMKHGRGVVISHSCTIDKPNRNTRGHVAPLAPLHNFDKATQETIRLQLHKSVLYLPEHGAMPEGGLDLRLMTR